MDTLTIVAYVMILYGIFTLYIAYFKPRPIWKIGKIQGFVQLLTETGTVIFFSIVGIGTIVGGVLILLR